MAPISLEEMEQVRLMNRIDTKFVTRAEMILKLLKEATGDYLIQEIDGQRNMPYFTTYFDTPDADMFYQHQRGKKNRQKIRTRIYEGTMDLPYLEIKQKNNKGRTKKKRILMSEGIELKIYEDFMSNHAAYPHDLLIPHISNHFYRITLVNKDRTERITIDTDLSFHNLLNENTYSLPQIAIIEWKREGHIGNSGFGALLRRLHIHESGFSKYCISQALTNPMLRHNRLNTKLRLIQKLIAKAPDGYDADKT